MGRKLSVRMTPLYILLLLYACVSVYPFVWMTLNAFKSTEEIFATNTYGLPRLWRLDNFKEVFTQYNFGGYFKNSVLVSAATVCLTSILALMFAYGVIRMRWKLSKVVQTYMLTGIMIPVAVVMIPLIITARHLHLSDSPLGLIVIYTAFGVAFASTIFSGFLRTLPYELEEAACMDGASIYRTFFFVIVPVVKPAIATVAIFSFLNSWNEFTLALVLVNRPAAMTLPLGLFTFFGLHGTDWGGLSAALVFSSFPVVVVYLFFSETIEKALTVGAVAK